MKVPNKVLHIISKMVSSAENTGVAGCSQEDIAIAKQWVSDGIAKRAALAAQPKAAEVE